MNGRLHETPRKLTEDEQRLKKYADTIYPQDAEFTYRRIVRNSDTGKREWENTTLTLDEAFQTCKAMMSAGDKIAHQALLEMYERTFEVRGESRDPETKKELARRALGNQ